MLIKCFLVEFTGLSKRPISDCFTVFVQILASEFAEPGFTQSIQAGLIL